MEIVIKIISVLSIMIMSLITSFNAKSADRSARLNEPPVSEYDSTIIKSLLSINPFNLEIIAPSTGVQFYKGGIVFLSSSRNESKMLPGHLSFGAVRSCYALLKDSVLGIHLNFSQPGSFLYPIDGISFTRDFKTMYYTRLPDNGKKEKIFKAVSTSDAIEKASWSEGAAPLNFCNDDFTYTHPALSADEKILVFSSDRTGSIGGMDLFMCNKEGDNWGAPQNLGAMINTKNNELYAFLDSKNNLFFSSDGLTGFGGYDIFICKFNGKSWDKPVNLSNLINSEKDEVAFTLDRIEGKTGFYTQGKRSGSGKKELFRITINKGMLPKDFEYLSDILYSNAALGPNVMLASAGKATALTAEEQKIPSPKLTTATTKTSKTTTTKPKSKAAKAAAIEAERLRAAHVADSLEAVRIEEERLRVEKARADSIEVVRKIEAEKIRKADSTAAAQKAAASKSGVVYRIQFASNSTSKGSYKITIAGKTYNTFEYLYNGSYRVTVGDLKTVAAAREFQAAVRKSGYPQAFVVAFKNNVRSLDPALFK
jgi:hypothetical protein